MRSRGQSPLLPFSDPHRVPAGRRHGGPSPATRVLVITLAVICVLYGAYSFLEKGGLSTQPSPNRKSADTGRGLAAHEEVAQLQGKNRPVLDAKHGEEVAQLQTQGQGHEKSPDLTGNGMTADRAAKATDSVDRLSEETPASGLYALEAADIDGKPVKLSKYAGKVSLVVNVASECGYTESNYKGLQQLYEKYRESSFEVLAFPCNSFGQQEPGSGQTIKEFAQSNYGVTFPLFEKAEVLGKDAHPIFKFLADNLPASGDVKDVWQPKWNFSKWLIDANGFPVRHYDSAFSSEQLERDIAAQLIKPS